MQYPMKYPKTIELNKALRAMNEFARLKYEQGTDTAVIDAVTAELSEKINALLKRVAELPIDLVFAQKEPDDFNEIIALRPDGPRKIWSSFNSEKYSERLSGGLIGRFAGCTLGANVEAWATEEMMQWAAFCGDQFPPVDYWLEAKDPVFKRYELAKTDGGSRPGIGGGCEFYKYTKNRMDGVPLDDDIVYTLLNLLIYEEYGPHFTTEDVAAAWVKYLPYICSVSLPPLKNLKMGIPPSQAAVVDNPSIQLIAGDIRADSWGYVAPGMPEKAAEFAYRDGYLSHRRNGIYGEMYFSAVIAAAFETDNTIDALTTGLSEIPKECLFSNDMRWALEEGKNIRNYLDARNAVRDRFDKMSGWHTNLNACLTVFGLMIGGDDFTKVIGETVAMGYDNDCSAATAGSIAGTVLGMTKIPGQWYRQFNNKVQSYIIGHPEFKIDDVIQRFEKQARRLYSK